MRFQFPSGLPPKKVNLPSEIQRHGGWAIKSLIELHKKRDSNDSNSLVLKTLKALRIFIDDVQEEDEYMSKCIDEVDAIFNKGALTLVHPQIYRFFELLNVPLNRFINLNRLKAYGPSFVKTAKKYIESGFKANLLAEFQKGCRSIVPNVGPEITTRIFDMIIKKMMNAYTGRVVKEYNRLQRGGVQCTLALRPALQADGLNRTKSTTGKKKLVEERKEENQEEESNLVQDIDPETIRVVEEELQQRDEELDAELSCMCEYEEE
jgi:hypothetical protein